MNLYLNTLSCQLTLAPNSTQSSVSIPAKLGTTLELKVFPNNDLGSGPTGIITCKPSGSYSSAAVASALSWTPPSSSGDGYTFALSLNTSELIALFSSNPASVTLMADVTWVSGGITSKTQTFTIVVANSVSNEDDGTPTVIPSLKATTGQAEAGTDDSYWMTPLKTAQAIATLSLPDALEFANLAAFPSTGSATVIYLAKDTGSLYRWTGSTYVQVGGSSGGSSGGLLQYDTLADFPSTGVVGSVYAAQDSNNVYRWDTTNSTYVKIGGTGSAFSVGGGTSSLGSGGIADGVVLCLPLNNVPLVDISPSEFSVINVNGVNVQVATPAALDGYAAQFNGTNQYIKAADGGDILGMTGDFSFSAWFKWIDGQYSILLTSETGFSSNSAHFLIYSDGSWGVGNPSHDGGATHKGNTPVTSGTWNHILIVRSGGLISFYLNGAYDGVGDGSPTDGDGADYSFYDFAQGGGFRVGNSPWDSTFFHGQIAQVVLWNRALADGAAAALYNGGNGIPISSFATTSY